MPPIQGLYNAMGFDASSDPLGIAVQQRARDKRIAAMTADPMAFSQGPLPDPRWEGFFQATEEANPGMDVKFGGPKASPTGTNQLQGFQQGVTGTYQNTQPAPWSQGGSAQPFAVPGGSYPPNQNRISESSAPVTGLQKAAPYTGAGDQAIWNPMSEAGQAELYRRKVAGR